MTDRSFCAGLIIDRPQGHPRGGSFCAGNVEMNLLRPTAAGSRPQVVSTPSQSAEAASDRQIDRYFVNVDDAAYMFLIDLFTHLQLQQWQQL